MFFSFTVTNIEFERKIRISEKTLERGMMIRGEGYHVVTLSRRTCKVTLSIKIVTEVGETWGNEKLGKIY